MIYSSKTPMLGSRRQHDVKYLKKLLKERNKVGNYHLHRIYITKDELSKLIEKCSKGKDKNKEKITFKNPNNKEGELPKRPFFVYLTKSQIKNLNNKKITRKTHYLDLSYSQFHKTCFGTVLLNRDIYYYASHGKLPKPPKVKQKLPLLAIEMRNLIDLDEEPIQPSKTKPDLIPTSKPKKIDELMKKNLINFNQSPYERYTPQKSAKKINTEVITALLNEIKYPLTKDILGLTLTKNLKEKISKLTLEAAVGLTWIIRSLVFK